MGARPRFLLTFVGVSLLVVVAAGCKANVTKEVLFVNDSVTHQSIIAIVQEMNDVAANDPAARYAHREWMCSARESGSKSSSFRMATSDRQF